MTNDELQVLANKVTSDNDVSDEEQIQFLEETDNLLQDVAQEQESGDIKPEAESVGNS